LAATERAALQKEAENVQTPSIKMAGGKSEEEGEGEEEDDEEEAGPETLTLPLSRIKKMLKSDPECSNITGDAVFLITKATELFIHFLAGECAEVADESGRKTINEADLGIAIHRVPTLAAILRADFPKMSKKEIEDMRLAKEKSKAEKKAANAALAEASAEAAEENKKDGEEGEGATGEMVDTHEGSAVASGEPEKATAPVEGGKKQGSLITMMARAREIAASNPKKPSDAHSSEDEDHSDVVLVDTSTTSSKKASSSKGLMDRFAVSLKNPEEKQKFWADSFSKSDEYDEANEQHVRAVKKKKVVKRKTKKTANVSGGNDDVTEVIVDDDNNNNKSNEDEIEEDEEEEEEEEEVYEVSNEDRIMERIRKVQLEEEKQRNARLKARLKLTDADNQALEEEGDIDLGFIRQRVSGKTKRRTSTVKKSSAATTKAKNKAAAKKKSAKVEIDGEDEGEDIEGEDVEEEEEPDRGRPDSSLQVELVADLPDDKVEVEEIDEDE
jgi:histone H3/H4